LLPVRQPGDPATLSSDIVAGDLILTMPLFAGRRLANETREADYLSRAAADRFVRTRQELVYEVSSLFYRILAQRHVIASLEFSRTAIDEHIRRVQALIEARKAAPVDLLRTEVRRADLDQRLMQERSALVLQHRYLAGMLGVKDGGDTLSLRGDLETGTAEAVDIGADLEALRAAGLDNRGDVLAARRAVKAQAHRVAAERGARWPAVSLFGTYGVRWAAGETIGAGNEIDDLGRIGFSLDLSIFEGGRIGARIREENAELEALRARLRAVELRAGLEVESALLDVRTSSERIEALRTALEQASESLRIERRRYELGAGTVVDVLDAQSALLETETNYYRALAERGAAVARLRLAIGEE
jgi:outer membrane protein TolC